MDSMLLLHLMSELFPHKVRAIYIDHQLQSSSRAWGAFVQNFAQQSHIPFTIQPVIVDTGNLENQAREARYAAFESHLKSNEVLVLAHHQQDQTETVLLRLLSGSGVKGLGAMKEIEQKKNICCWRPMLSVSRQQIEHWVEHLKIPYIQDLTNFDTTYDRAWCRETVWPVLQKRFPKMQEAISRTSILMQDADEILHEVLQQDLNQCGDLNHLDLSRLQQLSLARQRQLLSFWIKGKATYRPAFEMVERVQQEVIYAKADAKAALHWNHHYYVRYQNILYRVEKTKYLQKDLVSNVVSTIELQMDASLQLASGVFQIQPMQMGLSPQLLKQPLQLFPRQGGEKIHLYGRVGHWPLKKAIQEAQILPWLRHTIQILALDNVMLGVFTPKGFWLAQSSCCEAGGWQPNLISDVNYLRVEQNS